MKIRSILLSVLLAFSGLSLAMQGPTHYDILGVSSNATNAEIKAAYKKLSLKYNANGTQYQTLSDEDKKHADTMFTMVDNAYKTLSDYSSRQQYDQNANNDNHYANAAQGNHFAGNGNAYRDAHDNIMLLAGVYSAKTTMSYLSVAWDQYTIHKNLSAIKNHVALQLKNKEENKPITPIKQAKKLDLSWLAQLRHGEKPSPIEQAINQFDMIVTQNPQSLPTVYPQFVKIMDTYSDAIGNGKTNLFKAAALVGVSALGYFTSDTWVPYLLSSRLFYIGLRLFS